MYDSYQKNLVYKVIDGNTWHREVFDCFEQYMKELFEGKRELPGILYFKITGNE